MRIPVSKYHGCGNDFILLREEEADQIENLRDFIVAVCDRHTGIGADGLIIARTNPFFMEYYNQDGSRAPMCGNGIRCLTCFLRDQNLLEQPGPVTIETLAGTKVVDILQEEPFLVRVDMGGPIDDPASCAIERSEPIRNVPLDIDGETRLIDTFFMSTVHTMLFDENAMGDIETAGQAICTHPLFPEQTNVNFIHVLDDHTLEVQTYERGCGVTLACGTGVCASALDSWRKGLVQNSVDVVLKRGMLHIDIAEDETVHMTGPARKVCDALYEWEGAPALE